MEKKGYYAIIPANVRYDKRITPNAKLLYGELTALSNEKGYCWAGNQYFSDLYEVSKQSISSWIGQLRDSGYIAVQLEYREGTKEILNRYIRILDDPIQDILNTPTNNFGEGIQENLKDNNTINNTSNNLIDYIHDYDVNINNNVNILNLYESVDQLFNKINISSNSLIDYVNNYNFKKSIAIFVDDIF